MSKHSKHPKHQPAANSGDLYDPNAYSAPWDSKGSGDFFSQGGTGRCADTHKKLNILNGVLIGGNCGSPVEKAADVYVGFDPCFKPHGGMPWEARPATNIYYPIQDMGVPQNVERFKALVTWVCSQLQAGKVVHMGCIGGHGRTGLVFSAIVREALGTEDAVTWVRANYCHKAVESDAQSVWLNQHYGITVVKGCKSFTVSNTSTPLAGGTGNWWKQRHGDVNTDPAARSAARVAASGGGSKPLYDDGPASLPAHATALTVVKPVAKSLSIWRDPTAPAARRPEVDVAG